jgi:hypothetical protein
VNQDEKSNETDCCYYTNSNSSDICEVNNVIGDSVKINYSDISGNGMDNVTMVTAVSVSVPMATGNICIIKKNNHLQTSKIICIFVHIMTYN